MLAAALPLEDAGDAERLNHCSFPKLAHFGLHVTVYCSLICDVQISEVHRLPLKRKEWADPYRRGQHLQSHPAGTASYLTSTRRSLQESLRYQTEKHDTLRLLVAEEAVQSRLVQWLRFPNLVGERKRPRYILCAFAPVAFRVPGQD